MSTEHSTDKSTTGTCCQCGAELPATKGYPKPPSSRNDLLCGDCHYEEDVRDYGDPFDDE